ncbi:hypothetical protein [Pelodictyon phaeoclathratiforme]|uniref:hypothetical protein n=1 Tax=Pelodictyon phaeoclathratiforme TaxID=34090 RepID=UPI00167F2DFC
MEQTFGGSHTGKSIFIGKGVSCGDNAFDVFIRQKALRPFAGHFVDGVDEKHLVCSMVSAW